MIIEKWKAHWFWPLAAILAVFCWIAATYQPDSVPKSWELAVVFDVIVTLPILFAVCYRKRMSRKAFILRVIALQCLGIWVATKIVPTDIQSILPQLMWLRYVGFAVLVVLELWVVVALFKLVFRPDTKAEQLENMGMPPILAKFVLMEARFWRWVFNRLRQ